MSKEMYEAKDCFFVRERYKETCWCREIWRGDKKVIRYGEVHRIAARHIVGVLNGTITESAAKRLPKWLKKKWRMTRCDRENCDCRGIETIDYDGSDERWREMIVPPANVISKKFAAEIIRKHNKLVSPTPNHKRR